MPSQVLQAETSSLCKKRKDRSSVGKVTKIRCAGASRKCGIATPIVTVEKLNGDIRICADFGVTVNPQLMIERYPVSTPDEAYVKLGAGKKFTKVDAKQFYRQIEID